MESTQIIFHFSLIIVLINHFTLVNSIAWIPIGIAISALSGGVGVNYFMCKLYECCNDRASSSSMGKWIQYDYEHIQRLSDDLNERVYGQPLANKLIVNILYQHLSDDNPVKALSMSFHGWSGNGKNYVSEMIAKHLYKYGMKSSFVHRIVGTAMFPNKQRTDEYKEELQNLVKKNVAKCPRQLFIIDEVDKIPKGVLDGLHPFLEYGAIVNGVDYRKCIFIFLSNSGGKDINKVVYSFYKELKDRSTITLKDIEKQTILGAFNEKGGLNGCLLIEKNVIDYFIPFFPLEKKHVKLCIRYFVKQTFNLTEIKEEFLEQVSNDLDYFPEKEQLFSVSGCKKIPSKVRLYKEYL